MPGMGSTEEGSTRARDLAHAFHHALFHDWIIIAAVLVGLFIAWNLLRLRRLAPRVKESGVAPSSRHPVPPEPIARRVLRISFGLLWFVDGLLQSQAAMPSQLANEVIRPISLASPNWVRSLVGTGITMWNRHPVTAANSVFWIEIGIAVLMLSASRGFLSRAAGLAGVLWGAVVWTFGESFGGLFAPGYSWLFGAPGAALFYIAAGLLLMLPDRSWISPRLGLETLRSIGALLLVLATIQAWPGRGFWETRSNGADTLSTMLLMMSKVSQPRDLSSFLASASRYSAHHSFGINLFFVLVLAFSGGALFFVTERAGQARMFFGYLPVLPVIAVLIIVSLGVWCSVEDFGVLGGLGTDPNSMLPFCMLVITGFLATTRTAAIEPTGTRASRGWRPITLRSIPEFIEEQPVQSLRGFVALGAIFIIALGSIPMILAVIDQSSREKNARAPIGAVAMEVQSVRTSVPRL